VGLRGRHQAENAAVADAVLDALGAAGIATVEPAARRGGYAGAMWPGRLELVEVGEREVLLDGAHNPAGAVALAAALDDLRPFLAGGRDAGPPPLTLVHGSMADKDVDGIIRALEVSTALAGASIVATQVQGDRALPAADLARRWRTIRPDVAIVAIADVGQALEHAIRDARGPVVVAGSLYLVGEARRRWVDDPAVRDPEGPGA
jgi:dihydrofolate synthase/folylpolyglutamate synthase